MVIKELKFICNPSHNVTSTIMQVYLNNCSISITVINQNARKFQIWLPLDQICEKSKSQISSAIRSIVVMEASLPRKAFAMHRGPLPQRLFQLLTVPRCFPRNVQVRSAENFDRLQSVSHFCPYLFWQERCLGALHKCCFDKNALWCLLLLKDSLKNSAPTFHIIKLPKITTIEFLPLDWIYHYIKIMMVIGLAKIPRIEFLPLDLIYRSIGIMTVYTYLMSCLQDHYVFSTGTGSSINQVGVKF